MLKILLKKYALLFPFLLLGEIILGMGASILGPSFPYLSMRVNESLAKLGLLITARSIGFCISSLITGVVFCRLARPAYKIVFLGLAVMIMGCCYVGVPFSRSYYFLIIALAGFGAASAVIDTASNSLIIYIFGAVNARPLLHLLHSFISIGGFLAPLICQPFLVQMGTLENKDVYCSNQNNNDSNQPLQLQTTTIKVPFEESNLTASSVLDPFPPLAWPYLILLAGCLVSSFGLLGIAFYGFSFTAFTEDSYDEKPRSDFDIKSPTDSSRDLNNNVKTELRYRSLILILIFFFYWLHCGMENMFWSHVYSFAICSKLQLNALEASFLSMLFFVGFVSGRISGIVIARFISPTTIIVTEVISCIIFTTIMSIWANTNVYVAYITIAAFGYSISMVFGSGIGWIAARTDVTGAASSIWFIGAYCGISTLPALAGVLFSTPAGPISMAYLANVVSIVVLILFGIMNFLARFTISIPVTQVE